MRNKKRIISRVSIFAVTGLAVGGILLTTLHSDVQAATRLYGVQQIVSSLEESTDEFNILEIVPDLAKASMGFYGNGSDVVVDSKWIDSKTTTADRKVAAEAYIKSINGGELSVTMNKYEEKLYLTDQDTGWMSIDKTQSGTAYEEKRTGKYVLASELGLSGGNYYESPKLPMTLSLIDKDGNAVDINSASYCVGDTVYVRLTVDSGRQKSETSTSTNTTPALISFDKVMTGSLTYIGGTVLSTDADASASTSGTDGSSSESTPNFKWSSDDQQLTIYNIVGMDTTAFDFSFTISDDDIKNGISLNAMALADSTEKIDPGTYYSNKLSMTLANGKYKEEKEETSTHTLSVTRMFSSGSDSVTVTLSSDVPLTGITVTNEAGTVLKSDITLAENGTSYTVSFDYKPTTAPTTEDVTDDNGNLLTKTTFKDKIYVNGTEISGASGDVTCSYTETVTTEVTKYGTESITDQKMENPFNECDFFYMSDPICPYVWVDCDAEKASEDAQIHVDCTVQVGTIYYKVTCTANNMFGTEVLDLIAASGTTANDSVALSHIHVYTYTPDELETALINNDIALSSMDMVYVSNSSLQDTSSLKVASYGKDNDISWKTAYNIYEYMINTNLPVIIDHSIFSDGKASDLLTTTTTKTVDGTAVTTTVSGSNLMRLGYLLQQYTKDGLQAVENSSSDAEWTDTFAQKLVDADVSYGTYGRVSNCIYINEDTTAENGNIVKQYINWQHKTTPSYIYRYDSSASDTGETNLAGMTELVDEFISDNFYNKSNNDSYTTEYSLDGDTEYIEVQPSTILKYILNYNQRRVTLFKDTIKVLDIEPTKYSTLSEDDIRTWLGISDGSTTVEKTASTDAAGHWTHDSYSEDVSISNGITFDSASNKLTLSDSNKDQNSKDEWSVSDSSVAIITTGTNVIIKPLKSGTVTVTHKFTRNGRYSYTYKSWNEGSSDRNEDVTFTETITLNVSVSKASSMSSIQSIEIDQMTSSEFIGKLDDLIETYDMIYIGDCIGPANTNGSLYQSNGKTIYNDTSMNGLIYTHVGDICTISKSAAGLLDSEYSSYKKTGREATLTNGSNVAQLLKNSNGNYYVDYYTSHDGNNSHTQQFTTSDSNVISISKTTNDTCYLSLNGTGTAKLTRTYWTSKDVWVPGGGPRGYRGGYWDTVYTQHTEEVKITVADTGVNVIHGDPNYVHTRYSGNDITKDKYEELTTYAQAGYPVVIASSFYTSAGKINTSYVDNSSYLYQFMSESTGNALGTSSLRNVMKESNTTIAALVKYINMPRLNMVMIDWPDDYSCTTNSNGEITNAVWLQKTGNQYVLNYEFEFSNTAESVSGSNTYTASLFVDVNTDGQYTSDEVLDNLTITDVATNKTVSASKLQSGTRYKLSKTLSDSYIGLIPWKLEISLNTVTSDSSTDTTATAQKSKVHASTIGYTAIQPTQTTQIKVLQVAPSGYKSYAMGKLTEDASFSKMIQSVETYLKYNIDITYIYTDDFTTEANKYTSGTKFYEGYLKNYDMLIFGFSDMYSDISSNIGVEGIQQFIDSGKPAMFAHDTTSYDNGYFKNGATESSYHESGWSTMINLFLRSAAGMDRYGITVTELSELKSKSSNYNLAITDDLYKKIIAANKDVASKPYASSTDTNTYYETQGFSNTFLSQYRCAAYEAGQTSKNSQNSIYSSSSDDNQTTKKITQVNKGQITTYPYDVNITLADASCSVDSGNMTITQNSDGTFKITGTTNQNGEAGWYSSDSSIATVSNNNDKVSATITAASSGTVKITHTYNTYVNSRGGGYYQSNNETTVLTFTVGESSDSRRVESSSDGYYEKSLPTMAVETTHSQYYQLDFNYDVNSDGNNDLVVWYTLAGGNYDNTPNDVRNNYYIYSVGNVLYTGMGHSYVSNGSKAVGQQEAQLFINTIIAAYSSNVKDSTISICQDTNSKNTLIDSLYVSYDDSEMVETTDQSFAFYVNDSNIIRGDKTVYAGIFEQVKSDEYDYVLKKLASSDAKKAEQLGYYTTTVDKKTYYLHLLPTELDEDDSSSDTSDTSTSDDTVTLSTTILSDVLENPPSSNMFTVTNGEAVSVTVKSDWIEDQMNNSPDELRLWIGTYTHLDYSAKARTDEDTKMVFSYITFRTRDLIDLD